MKNTLKNQSRTNAKTLTITLILMCFVSFYSTAQKKTAEDKDTKVVFVVSQKGNKIAHLLQYDALPKGRMGIDSKKLKAQYPKSDFYLGALEGNFKKGTSGAVIPALNSKLIMYIDKSLSSGGNFLPGDQFIPGDQFLPGDQFRIGNANVKLESIDKSKLIFKTIK